MALYSLYCTIFYFSLPLISLKGGGGGGEGREGGKGGGGEEEGREGGRERGGGLRPLKKFWICHWET